MKKWFLAISLLANPLFANENDCLELLQTTIQQQVKKIGQLESKYQKNLGIFSNPFDFVLTAEEAEKLFDRLKVRRKDGEWVESPLGVINTELKKIHVHSPSYDSEMVTSLIDEIGSSLKVKGMEQMDWQSNLLALQYVREYLRRFDNNRKVVDREGRSVEKPEKPEKPEKQEQQEEEPQYPEIPDSYKPQTDELSEQSNKTVPYRLAETNFRTQYFVGKRYGEIRRHSPMPFGTGALPIPSGQSGAFKETPKEMILRPLGRREMPLFLPSGHRPLQPSDSRASIVVEDSGNYTLKLKEDLPEVTVPLVEEGNMVEMPPNLEYYSRPVGFDEKEWPDKIQMEILRRFTSEAGKEKPLEVARAIAKHISGEYLYSVGARPETDPIEALKAGAFQCDMAAFIMVGLLRDVYQIPARAVGGYPAQKYKGGGDHKSYLILPSVAHAWVEVFHDGRWNTFDPIPVKKDRKEKEKDSDSEYSSWKEQGEGRGEQEGLKQESSSGKVEKTSDHVSRLEKNTREGLERDFVEGDKVGPEDGELIANDLADHLELGSLELEPLYHNPLVARAMRVFLQSSLDPHRGGGDIQNLLNGMLKGSSKISDPEFQQLYREAMDVHSSNHPGLNEWIEQIMAMTPKQDLEKTHQDVFKLKSSLELYARVLDSDGGIPYPEKLLDSLNRAYELIDGQSHPDSKDIAIVKNLTKNLPNLALQLLKRRYDLSVVGPNTPTKKVAGKLKKGKLNDLRLMAILNPLTDFILNASPRPEGIPVKQWEKNTNRTLGKDLLPLDRPSDIFRALISRPDFSIEENIKSGTAFVVTRRKISHVSAHYGKDEAERITIVLYDTSGSMGGDPGLFQAGLISSFTAKALSDLSPSGRHRHKVVLLPFDHEPGTPTPVTNTAQGLDVIDNYVKNLANTGGGTDIQAALIQAMSLIADAEKRAGEPLAAANIVLMTDGDDGNIDVKELYQARKAIDRETPLQTMFIAISGTNPGLMEFAMSSRSAGVEKGFYREFRNDHIRDILEEAKNSNFEGQDYFYTDKKPGDISKELDKIMESARTEGVAFSRKIRNNSGYTTAQEHLDNLDKIKWNDIPDIERPLDLWLFQLRAFAQGNPVFQDRRLLEVIADDLLVHFEHLAGADLNTLSDYEQEQLRHFIRYAAGLEVKEPQTE